jgi:hypothetical protein
MVTLKLLVNFTLRALAHMEDRSRVCAAGDHVVEVGVKMRLIHIPRELAHAKIHYGPAFLADKEVV